VDNIYSPEAACGAPAFDYDGAMSDLDFYHQYRWAIEKLEAAFGQGNVVPRPPGDRGEVLALEVRNPAAPVGAGSAASESAGSAASESAGSGAPEGTDGRSIYLVVLKDHLLMDLNKHAEPGIFLDGEIQKARAWFEGKSSQSATIP
jgi:hypothetical protein